MEDKGVKHIFYWFSIKLQCKLNALKESNQNYQKNVKTKTNNKSRFCWCVSELKIWREALLRFSFVDIPVS